MMSYWLRPGRLRSPTLDRRSHEVAPFGPGAIVVNDVLEAEQVTQHELFQHVPRGNRIGGVIDIAGKHKNQGARSQVQLWQELADVSLTHQYVWENDSIEVLRKHLQNGWLLFDSRISNKRAPDGTALDVLAEPELWRWPDRSYRQNEARRPVDKNNHAMKAIAYGAINKTGVTMVTRKPVKTVVRKYF